MSEKDAIAQDDAIHSCVGSSLFVTHSGDRVGHFLYRRTIFGIVGRKFLLDSRIAGIFSL